ncbi:MAG: DUF3795 domain-containing protein [Acutalibacteraceae bacterium]|nr:DUF3795 domain-containing protein [Acutalibacteraceae bacterium]
MKGICGADCNNCGYGKSNNCKGCSTTLGCPFGKQCFIYRYITTGGEENYKLLKKQLIDELNSLDIPGMPNIDELYPMNGSYVNLAYPMPNNKQIKLLNDNNIYLCNQVKCEFNDGELVKCFGLVADMNFLLVSEYGANCTEPEIIIYKKR